MLRVIGIGHRPFDTRTKEIVSDADIILASGRLEEVFKRSSEGIKLKGRLLVIDSIDEIIGFIRGNMDTKKIVLLASGDPLFFGIGRRSLEEFGSDKVELTPDLSSIQMAFARIKEAWDDAMLISLHGGSGTAPKRKKPYDLDDLPALILRNGKLCILTDRINNASEIAKVISSSAALEGLDIRMHVCGRLGYDDEKIISGMPQEMISFVPSDPHIVILCIKGGTMPIEMQATIGLTESEISHSEGLITKDEIRAVSLHKLRLPAKGVLWDIGAGSGSVSIEAARLSPYLKVFAVERDPEQTGHIKKNIKTFRAANIRVIDAEAPEALKGLPAPDRVFIGGSGGRIKEITGIAAEAGADVIVINASTLETLHTAVDALRKNGYDADVSQVSAARSKPVGEGHYLSAMNPVFIIRGQRTA